MKIIILPIIMFFAGSVTTALTYHYYFASKQVDFFLTISTNAKHVWQLHTLELIQNGNIEKAISYIESDLCENETWLNKEANLDINQKSVQYFISHKMAVPDACK